MGGVLVSAICLNAIVRSYLEAQLWAQRDLNFESDPNNHGEHLDATYQISDISPQYIASVRSELADVIATNRELVQRYHDVTDRPERMQWSRSDLFGYDFYLTREGHGTGFWDRGLGKLGDDLTAVADSYGEATMLFDNGDGVLRG